MKLECKNLCFKYDSSPVLNDVSLSANGNELVILLGPNGNGKTTLIKCLNKLLKPESGSILFDDKKIEDLKSTELAKMIGYVPQILEFSSMNVYDEIMLGRLPYIKYKESLKDHEEIAKIIKELCIEDIALKNINNLSGGEKQKVAIARALVGNPKILLFDEPTSNLDIKNQVEVMKLIKKIAKDNNILVFITMHDINLSLRFGDRFILLKKGSIISDGNVESINEENILQAYNLKAKIEKINGINVMIPNLEME